MISVYVDIMKMLMMMKAMIMMNSTEMIVMNSTETLLSLQELEMNKYIFQDGEHLQQWKKASTMEISLAQKKFTKHYQRM